MTEPQARGGRRIGFFDHTAQVSGAELSLLGLLGGLQADAAGRYAPLLICPPGELARRAEALGVPVALLAVPPFGYTRSPVRLAQYAAGLVASAWRLRQVAREADVALLHANSVRAGLIACLAASRGGLPVVCHVRDVLPAGLLTRATFRLLRRATALVAIAGYVANSLGGDAALRGKVRVVYNGVDGAALRAQARQAAGPDWAGLGALPPDAGPLLGVVGQLTPWKGQADAIAALPRILAALPAAQLLIAGEAKFTHASARYDTRRYAADLRALAAGLGVADHVQFLGQRDDIAAVLSRLDLLLVPSWEEPFGRVVIEAQALGVPVIGTRAGGIPEILAGADDLLVPPQQPARWRRRGRSAGRRGAPKRTGRGGPGARRARLQPGAACARGDGALRRDLAARRPLVLFANHTATSAARDQPAGDARAGGRRTLSGGSCLHRAAPLTARLAAHGIAQTAWEVDAFGFARRPRELAATLRDAGAAARQLRRTVRAVRPALVHANSIAAACSPRAPSSGWRAARGHVRDYLPAGPASRVVRLALHARAALVLGVSRHALAAFRVRAPGGARYAVLHDGVDPGQFASQATASGAAALRAGLGITGAGPLLGVVGQLTPWKGQDDAIRALALLLPRHPDARLLIVGEAKFTHPGARYDTDATGGTSKPWPRGSAWPIA